MGSAPPGSGVALEQDFAITARHIIPEASVLSMRVGYVQKPHKLEFCCESLIKEPLFFFDTEQLAITASFEYYT